MPIQRSLTVSSELKSSKSNLGRGAADRHSFPLRLSLPLGLLLLAVLLNGCDALPPRPRLPEIPFLQLRHESDPAGRLHLFLPEEGQITEALRDHVSSWAAGREIQVDLTTTTDYSQELGNLLAADDPPDLVVVTEFLLPDLAASGLLTPAEDGFLDPTGFPPQLAAAFTRPGEDATVLRYCLPREVRTLALVYDSGGLAAAGQSPPTDWDSLREIAAGQTDVDLNRFGFIQAPDLSRWLPFLYGAGGEIFGESGGLALQSPAAAAAMDWYIQIFRDNFAGHAGESNNEWAGEVLGKGKGALTIEGNWVVPYYDAEFPDFPYGIAPLPNGPANEASSVAFSSCYAVTTGSERKEDAFELAAYLSGPDVVGSLPNDGGWMPAHDEMRDDWKKRFPHLAAFADAVPTARVWQLPPGFDTFLNSFNRGMVQLFAANVEAADFFAELHDLGETLLGTAGEPESVPSTSQTPSP